MDVRGIQNVYIYIYRYIYLFIHVHIIQVVSIYKDSMQETAMISSGKPDVEMSQATIVTERNQVAARVVLLKLLNPSLSMRSGGPWSSGHTHHGCPGHFLHKPKG